MIFNRPTGSSHDLPVSMQYFRLVINNFDVEKGQEQLNQMPTLDAFILHTAKLYYIVDEISDRLSKACLANTFSSDLGLGIRKSRRTEIPGSRMLTYLTTVNQFDRTLLRWRDSLPDSLKFHLDETHREGEIAGPIQRQRNVLHARFLGLRMLLHRQSLLYLLQGSESRPLPSVPPNEWRPLFSEISVESDSAAYGKNSDPSPLETTAALINAGLFVSSARQLLQLLARTSSHVEGWWFDFHCKYSSLVQVVSRSKYS